MRQPYFMEFSEVCLSQSHSFMAVEHACMFYGYFGVSSTKSFGVAAISRYIQKLKKIPLCFVKQFSCY